MLLLGEGNGTELRIEVVNEGFYGNGMHGMAYEWFGGGTKYRRFSTAVMWAMDISHICGHMAYLRLTYPGFSNVSVSLLDEGMTKE